MPRYGEEFENQLLCFHDLKSISRSQIFLKALEQKIHNLGATNKAFRYKEILKILLTKYYDEIKKVSIYIFNFLIKKKILNSVKDLPLYTIMLLYTIQAILLSN